MEVKKEESSRMGDGYMKGDKLFPYTSKTGPMIKNVTF